MTQQTPFSIPRPNVVETDALPLSGILSSSRHARHGIRRGPAFVFLAVVIAFVGAATPVQKDWGRPVVAGLNAPAYSCSLPAPASLNAQRTGPSTASLTWDAVSGADAYRVRVYEAGTHELISNTVENGTSAYLSFLESGVSYYCSVAAICSLGATSDFIIIEEVLD